MAVTIAGVELKSPAAKAGIRPGEILLSLNGNVIGDVLDYRFYMAERRLAVEIQDPDTGEIRCCPIRKGEYQELGLEFDTYLMDKQRSCKNKCIFCFIDQMPPDMRGSLYFKDDDSRLSFLFGNYITLTNLEERDVQRILEMHISPVNISIHTTNPELRVRMMKNPRAADSLAYLERFAAGGIRMNTQLVLCPGINDGPELERSLKNLGKLYPAVESIACVPVGLTRYREGLFPLEPFSPSGARAVVETIEAFARDFYQKHGQRLAYPADEFFLKAGIPIREAVYYGEFPQLENGVGMVSLFREEFRQALEDAEKGGCRRSLSIATGEAAAPLMGELARLAMDVYKGLEIQVYEIKNRFFGEHITVSGLITGRDLSEQLAGRELGERLLIPVNMLRRERDLFLDDMSPADLEKVLHVPVEPVETNGQALLDALTGF